MKAILFPLCLSVFCISLLFGQNTDPFQSLSDHEKLFGLSKVWKEADKNFAFFDQVPELDWEQTYRNYIPKVLATTDNYSFYKVLQEMVSLLRDGHTRVVVPWQLRNIYEAKPPMIPEWINGEVVITDVGNDTLQEMGLVRGVVITKIDGVPVKEYAEKNILPYLFYSTEQDKLIRLYRESLLQGPKDQPVLLTIRDKGKQERQLSVSRSLRWHTTFSGKKIYEYQILEDNIGYLKINRFWGERIQEKFDSLYTKIRQNDALILDVSTNSGGNSDHAHYVLSHFADAPFTSSRWKTPMYLPAYASWGHTSGSWFDNDGDRVEPVEAEKRYLQPLVLLISERTYSAGEDFVSAFVSTKRGIIVGRPTAGTTGNPIGFALPGGGGLQVCTKRDYLQDGTEFVGYGIPPEIIVEKELDDQHLVRAGLKVLQKELTTSK